jgi:N-acetylglucosamine malate deacetylase 2
MSQRSRAESLFTKLEKAAAEAPTESLRVLVLAAHPDDETIGASCVLGRVSECAVIYLTDGAPRNSRWRSPHVNGSREFYACVRAEEAASALALVGVPAVRIMFLGAVDQEAIHEVQRLLEDFIHAVQRIQPSFIITHPYEGGHPDHDTAALVARLALRSSGQRLGSTPELLEMTSYHAVDGRRVSGEFLSWPGVSTRQEQVILKLSPPERASKARMLGCYVSQWHVLSEFPLEPEGLRVAPLYNFSQPPHHGPLWYECLQWPLTGHRWRELASAAVAQYGELACR